jgi:hypothetical protein
MMTVWAAGRLAVESDVAADRHLLTGLMRRRSDYSNCRAGRRSARGRLPKLPSGLTGEDVASASELGRDGLR